MWTHNWRESIWSEMDQAWDLVIIGGGITGAGILREATRLGLHVLLIEQRDFAWGTSSRSSKLVHGGLRYLKEGKLRLTRTSVHEREQLLKEGPGLVEPLSFLLATYEGDSPGRITYGAGLTVYDLLALRWSHRYYSAQDFRLMAGNLSAQGLQGGYRYGDAKTDDARLVLRVIREAVADGGTAINYVRAEELLRDDGVKRVRVQDMVTGRSQEIEAPVVVNATGAWADRLRAEVGGTARIRPLRGSHLIFPRWRLPVSQAISFLHPLDGRPVFLFPWEGATLVGTTDVDYGGSLDEEPAITADEVAYLMAAVEASYPMLEIDLDDVISTFAGVRPVIGSGKLNPSEESRDHIIWQEKGLLTVTGGKLTTFRVVALEVLNKLRRELGVHDIEEDVLMLEQVDGELDGYTGLSEATQRRLLGRYGAEAQALVEAAGQGELEAVPGTSVLWAELRWATHAEGVVHLDDLLLRRARLGLLVKNGSLAYLPRIRAICQEELGWDDARWEAEEAAYLRLWECCYSLPPKSTIPDWREQLRLAREKKAEHELPARAEKPRVQLSVAGLIMAVTLILTALMIRKKARMKT